jgi:surfactin family lipopeptide synthetase A
LAHLLREQYGVRANDLVGILLDRSEKMVVAILGVLKAGAAYLPVDPEYPAARRDFILGDAAPKLLITQTDYLFDIAGYEGQVFAADVQLDDAETPLAPDVPVRPDDLAYVIYTSGSTGNPKGVQIEHRGLGHYAAVSRHRYPDIGACVLLSSIAFDMSVACLFSTLCCGGRLCILPPAAAADVDAVADYVAAQGITYLLTVPSYYKLLLPRLAGRPNALAQAVVAGEACPVRLVEEHFRAPALRDCQFINEYGPTECAIWASVHVYDRQQPAFPTIGKPVENTRIYLLDGRDQLVPPGVAGEICIAGPGLGRGYLNRPDLTAERFVPDPFRPGERMYRTGDLARRRRDGTLDFTGRKDDQVKVRGYRIETREIENALLAHPAVRAAVVVARPNEAGDQELVAYLVAGEALGTAALQAYLGAQLPAFALPSHYVPLEAIPFTPNGKVDRNALPDPRGAGLATGEPYVAPRDAAEAALAAVWEEVLERKPVGIRDSFFNLGGDSIRVLRLTSELKKRCRVDVPVADLYKHHTIERLSDHLRGQAAPADGSPDPAAGRAGVLGELDALRGKSTGAPRGARPRQHRGRLPHERH